MALGMRRLVGFVLLIAAGLVVYGALTGAQWVSLAGGLLGAR